MDFLEQLNDHGSNGRLPEKFVSLFRDFHDNYLAAVSKEDVDHDAIHDLLNRYAELVIEQIKTPYPFEPFHQRVTEPFDYSAFGLDLIRPLILSDSSTVRGENNIERIVQQLDKKDNVVLFANHQTEPDPQIIRVLLEKNYPKLADDMIFVAGHRVTTDPLAIPFSMGCNLLCIYSKRHIDHPPEEKHDKLLHNQRTMKRLSELLSEGGKCIYVAPSGGRDRQNPQTSEVEVAPFDAASVEMFWLMAQKAGHPTHFYPLSLDTYNVLPPPQSVEKELGEERQAARSAVHFMFDQELDMENLPGMDTANKKERRQRRCDYIWEIVNNNYKKLTEAP